MIRENTRDGDNGVLLVSLCATREWNWNRVDGACRSLLPTTVVSVRPSVPDSERIHAPTAGGATWMGLQLRPVVVERTPALLPLQERLLGDKV